MRFILLLILTPFLFATQIDNSLFEGDLKERYQKIEQGFSEQNISTPEAKEQLQYHQSLVTKIKTIINNPINIETLSYDELKKSSVSKKTYYTYFQSLINYNKRKREAKEKQIELQEKILFLKNKIEKVDDSDKDLLFSLQLQYAIYKLQQSKSKEELEKFEKAYHTLFNHFLTALEKVNFQEENLNKNKIEDEIEVLDKKIVALEVKKERQLITLEKVEPAVENQLSAYQKDIEKLYFKQIDSITLNLLFLIKEKKSNEVFKQLHKLESLFSNIHSDLNLYIDYRDILQSLIKQRLGTLTVVFSNMKQNVQQSLYGLVDWFSNPLFIYHEQPVSIINIMKVIVIIILGFIIGWIYKKKILSLQDKWSKVSLMSIKLLANVGYYFIILITFIIAMASIGLDLTSLSLIAGALSIGIGFGLQTVVSNFVAGIILMFERSIRIGDLLELSNTLKGEVTDIRIRSTTIKTFDNIEIIVPNATFIQSNVINWTLEDKIRRLHIPFSVAYGSDVDMVNETVLQALEKSTLLYVRNNEKQMPKVWMAAMGQSSVDMELLVWVNSEITNMPLKTDFLILIYKTLNAHNIEIPFPQMDVHLKKVN
ncbi:mechanosensitive ion channel [bacterium]|nr:mechanosensitive ion channel [bacterium]MBU1957223.1 mechanosensitive ion channel [bacterium]